MEDPRATQTPVPTASAPTRSTCPNCGGATPLSTSNRGNVTLVGYASMAFPSLSVEKEFAQLLGKKDFKGFTDRKTLHDVLFKKENRYLARKMCGLFTVYGGGSTPAYILIPEAESDRDLLVDTLKRDPKTSEFDVVKGRLEGIAPPALCNAQELPIVVYSQLYSFTVDEFVKAIPRPARVPADDFEAVAKEAFHRTMRMAANGIGPTRGLTFVALSSGGYYQLIGEKNADNFSLAEIRVNQAKSNPDCADIGLKFAKRDTGFSETFRMRVNFTGPFEFLDDGLNPSYQIW